jgi:hypothetical protein
MADPYRKLFLAQAEFIVAKEPNGRHLHELLRLTVPELLLEDVKQSNATRSKAFKALKLRVHPDKHPENDSDTATKIFQDCQTFHDACSLRLLQGDPVSDDNSDSDYVGRKAKSRRTSPPGSGASSPTISEIEDIFPTKFNVRNKWQYLPFDHPVPPDPNQPVSSKQELVAVTAYQCINARGGIVHGRRTEQAFVWAHAVMQIQNPAHNSVQDIFDLHGGTRQLGSVSEIKQELMERGPVVSTSFRLTETFSQAVCPEYSVSFVLSQTAEGDKNAMTHDLLIVGWDLTPIGEVWLTMPVLQPNASLLTIPIAFGQFGITDCCVAPLNNFEQQPWQAGPYLDQDLSSVTECWRTWTSITLSLTSEELEHLAATMGPLGFFEAIAKKSRLVVRDKTKIAHSRSCLLQEVGWDHEKRMWKVTAVFV